MSSGLLKFEIIDKIGQGQFSTVYRAKWINPPDLAFAAPLPIGSSAAYLQSTGHQIDLRQTTPSLVYENQSLGHFQHQQADKGRNSNGHSDNNLKRNERFVALKRIKFYDIQNSKARMDYLKEVNLLQQVKHPNIINFHISFIERNELYIVLELADGGDLSKLIRYFQKKRRLIPEQSILKYFTQVCSAVEYIHSKRILHRDIKPANIFMTSNGCVKLGDFGLSRFFSQNTRDAHSIVGTFYYMSPERIQESGYSFSSDVWSLGCVLYELITLDSPFSILNHEQHIMNTNNDQEGTSKRPLTQPNQVQQQAAPTPTQQTNNNPYNLQWLIDRIIRAEYPCLDGYKNISPRLRHLTDQCLNPVQELRPDMKHICEVVNEAYLLCQNSPTPPMTPLI